MRSEYKIHFKTEKLFFPYKITCFFFTKIQLQSPKNLHTYTKYILGKLSAINLEPLLTYVIKCD